MKIMGRSTVDIVFQGVKVPGGIAFEVAENLRRDIKAIIGRPEMSEKLKKEFIELLEKDIEFRYTIAGYLGLSEILKRLDIVEESIRKLWKEVKSLREGQESS